MMNKRDGIMFLMGKVTNNNGTSNIAGFDDVFGETYKDYDLSFRPNGHGREYVIYKGLGSESETKHLVIIDKKYPVERIADILLNVLKMEMEMES